MSAGLTLSFPGLAGFVRHPGTTLILADAVLKPVGKGIVITGTAECFGASRAVAVTAAETDGPTVINIDLATLTSAQLKDMGLIGGALAANKTVPASYSGIKLRIDPAKRMATVVSDVAGSGPDLGGIGLALGSVALDGTIEYSETGSITSQRTGLRVSATVGSSLALQIGLTPQFSGWSINLIIGPEGLSLSAGLSALTPITGADIAASLASVPLGVLGSVSLKSLSLVVAGGTQASVHSGTVIVGFSSPWTLVDDALTLESVTVGVNLRRPEKTGQSAVSSWQVTGVADIFGTRAGLIVRSVGDTLTIEARPGAAVASFDALAESSRPLLGSAPIISAELPSSLTKLTNLIVDHVRIVLKNGVQEVDFEVRTAQPWLLAENYLQLRSVSVALTIRRQAEGSGFAVFGAIRGVIGIGPTSVDAVVRRPAPDAPWTLDLLIQELRLPGLPDIVAFLANADVAASLPPVLSDMGASSSPKGADASISARTR